MRRTNVLIALFCSVAILFSGCKEDDIPALEYKSQGFIKGKLTTNLSDNSPFIEDFSYSQYMLFSDYSNYEMNSDNSLDFTIERNDYNRYESSVSFNFSLDNSADITPNDPEMTIRVSKESEVLSYFSMNSDNGANTLAITEFSFNATSGQVKGKYTIAGSENSSDKSATVTGEFDVVVKKLVN